MDGHLLKWIYYAVFLLLAGGVEGGGGIWNSDHIGVWMCSAWNVITNLSGQVVFAGVWGVCDVVVFAGYGMTVFVVVVFCLFVFSHSFICTCPCMPYCNISVYSHLWSYTLFCFSSGFSCFSCGYMFQSNMTLFFLVFAFLIWNLKCNELQMLYYFIFIKSSSRVQLITFFNAWILKVHDLCTGLWCGKMQWNMH